MHPEPAEVSSPGHVRCRSRTGSSQQTPPFVTPGRHSCNQLAHLSQQLPALLCCCETSGVSKGIPQAHHECSSATFNSSCYFGEKEGAAVAECTTCFEKARNSRCLRVSTSWHRRHDTSTGAMRQLHRASSCTGFKGRFVCSEGSR